MWWMNQPEENTVIEINPQELMNFIFEEVQFLQSLDQLLEKALDLRSFFEGKTFFYCFDIFSALSGHFAKRLQYFTPREVQD